MNNITSLVRPDLLEYSAYSSARDEAISGKIWLNANESPFDVEIANGIKINRYPDKPAIKLIEKFAAIYGINTNQLIATRGSDEGIHLLIQLFCTAGKDAIMICPPTYGMYAVSAKLQQATIISAPLNKANDFQLDLQNIHAHWNKQVKLIFLCSPNNPTGNLLNKEDILSLCDYYAGKSMIVVDEAYIDFATQKSLTHYINKYENLVILRTCSKAFGLAGIRLGFVLANPEVIAWLTKIMTPYPLPTLVVEYVCAFLTTHQLAEIAKHIEIIQLEKMRLRTELKKLTMVKHIWASEANFLLLEVSQAEKVMQVCANNGIIIRSMFDKPGLDNCVRISMGLPNENEQLLTLLQALDRGQYDD